MILIQLGDLVVSGINAYKGAIAIYEGSTPIAATIHYSAYQIDPRQADTRFVWYLLRSAVFQSRLEQNVPGGIKTELKPDRLLPVTILLPPLDEQRRIVAHIDALAEQIAAARGIRQGAVEEAENLLSATSTGIFASKPDTASALGDFTTVIDPNPSHRYPMYVEQGIPMISTVNLTGEDGIDVTTARHVSEEFWFDTVGKYDVGIGDVIFSRKGKVGYARPYPSEQKLAMTHTLCIIKPEKSRLDSRYLLHFARSSRFLSYLTNTMNPNSGVPTLGLNVIRSARIETPHLDEQRRIVAYLDSLQAEVERLKRLQSDTAAELDALLPSLLDRAFKGEL